MHRTSRSGQDTRIRYIGSIYSLLNGILELKKIVFGTNLRILDTGLKCGRAQWQKGGGKKKRCQYCSDDSGRILYLRALQGHSGRNPIDPTLQDNVLIPNNIFKSISHIGCAVVRSHFGSSRDPSPRLEFPLHLASRQPHQDSFRVRFLFAVYIAWPLLLVALSSSVGNLVVPDRVRSQWWNMDTKLGGSQLRAEGRLFRGRTSHWQISSPSRVIRRRETTVGTSLLSRLDAAETRHVPCLDGQVLFPGVTHRAIKWYQKVRMQSWRIARSLIRLRLTRRSEQMTNCVEFSRTCQMNTSRSSTVTVSRQKCSHWMMRKSLCWQPRGNSYLCKIGLRNKRITWSESPERIRRNNSIVWKFYKKWIEADQELDAAHAKQVQAKHEMSILVAEQTAENAKAVNQGTSGIQSLSSPSNPDPDAQQTILSVFRSVLSMQNMGCHSVAEQLMAAGATDEEVM